MQKLNLGVGLVLLFSSIAYAQSTQAPSPTVEQRLGSAIAALIVENARLATVLESARQMIAKMQAESNKGKDK